MNRDILLIGGIVLAYFLLRKSGPLAPVILPNGTVVPAPANGTGYNGVYYGDVSPEEEASRAYYDRLNGYQLPLLNLPAGPSVMGAWQGQSGIGRRGWTLYSRPQNSPCIWKRVAMTV